MPENVKLYYVCGFDSNFRAVNFLPSSKAYYPAAIISSLYELRIPDATLPIVLMKNDKYPVSESIQRSF